MPLFQHPAQTLYLELIKKSLGDFLYQVDPKIRDVSREKFVSFDQRSGARRIISDYNELKENGLTSSVFAHTIIGMKRLNNLEDCMRTVIEDDIPGDFLEAGVLRGGACIFMRAFLKVLELQKRKVWVADSFEGFPPGELMKNGLDPQRVNPFACSLEEVKENFKRYDLLDDQVVFLAGWFEDTFPTAPIEKLSILRLDSDLYRSTRYSLEALYPKVSPGGFIIIDDYYAFAECAEAVREYRKAHNISAPIERIDPVAVYWRKPFD